MTVPPPNRFPRVVQHCIHIFCHSKRPPAKHVETCMVRVYLWSSRNAVVNHIGCKKFVVLLLLLLCGIQIKLELRQNRFCLQRWTFGAQKKNGERCAVNHADIYGAMFAQALGDCVRRQRLNGEWSTNTHMFRGQISIRQVLCDSNCVATAQITPRTHPSFCWTVLENDSQMHLYANATVEFGLILAAIENVTEIAGRFKNKKIILNSITKLL